MEKNEQRNLKMNIGYILVKREAPLTQRGGLVMNDNPGNAVKGLIVESADTSLFKVGSVAYCSSGVEVRINGEQFLVVDFKNIFFTLD